MLAKMIRKLFGSVRLAMTLAAVTAGLIVVAADVRYNLRLSTQLYGYLTALVGAVVVFVWKDTERPSGYRAGGFRYDMEDDRA